MAIEIRATVPNFFSATRGSGETKRQPPRLRNEATAEVLKPAVPQMAT